MRWVLCVCLLLVGGCHTPGEVEVASEKQEPNALELPGVRLDRAAGYVDFEARISPRAGEWLELVACFDRSFEHESLVTLVARPSHVHLALTLLGMQPGAPMRWDTKGGEMVMQPAHGSAARLFFVLNDGDVVPAESWVVDQRSGEAMPKTMWVFAGSRFVEIAGQTTYAADINGPVATLVHFGDEVLAPAVTDLTNRTDEQQYNASEQVPPVGSTVWLRVQPVEKPAEITPR